MNIKRARALELRALGLVVGVMLAAYLCAYACWHVGWLSW